MIVRGREIKFLRTVLATCKIADLCPDGSISKIGALFGGADSKVARNEAEFIRALNEGYEMNRHFDEPEYEPKVISLEEILSLTNDQFSDLFAEAVSAFQNELPTVEVEEKKAKKKTDETSL